MLKQAFPIIFLVGVQGSGKTRLGKLIAPMINGLFYDGDDAIPLDSDIKKQIAQGLTISPTQVDQFISDNLLPAVKQKQQIAISQKKALIVSQALFFNKHRLLLQEELGEDVYFVALETSLEVQTEQIVMRGVAQGKSAGYIKQEVESAMISNPYFEKINDAIRGFSLPYLGAGHEDEFLEAFRKLPFFDILPFSDK